MVNTWYNTYCHIFTKSVLQNYGLSWDKEWILWVESRDTYEEDQDLEATFSVKCWTASMENETEGEDGLNWPNYGFVECEHS